MNGAGENPIQMSGSNLCIHRNETAWPCYFGNRIINVLSPSFQIHVSVSDLYIPRIGLPILMQPNRRIRSILGIINRAQIHDCRNWERGRAVPFLGIQENQDSKEYLFCSQSYV